MNKSEINVLVVDDDPNARRSLSEVIKRHGFRVMEAKGFEEAINATRLKPTHAFLIDCMLPKLSGVQLAQKLRELGFTETPIILFTGVFKDRSFAVEAMEKTKAVEILHKPILNDELLSLLENSLSQVISSAKMPLYQLLSKPFASHRERRKALEQVEEFSGFDLPFVLCILMDDEVTGHLNCIAQDGQIFGITLSGGNIVEVDIENSKQLLAKVIVENNFCDPQDMEPALTQAKGDLTTYLVANNLMSPHAAQIAKNILTLESLKSLMTDSSLQMNFSPAHKRESESSVDMSMLTPVLHEMVEKQIDSKWLAVFYETWMDHPVRLGPNYTNSHPVVGLPLVSSLHGLIEELRDEKTLEEVIDARGFAKSALLKAVHLLAIRRIIVFDESRKARVSGQSSDRLKTALEDVSDKNHYEIFRYFGASQAVSIPDVERIYREFAKANHPDKITKDADSETKKMVNELFQRVTAAYNVLKDQAKREEYDLQIQRDRAKNQIKAESFLDTSLKYLQKGQYQDALVAARESLATYRSHEGALYEAWALAKVNSGNKWNREAQAQIKSFLDSYPPEKRRTANYQLVQGIYYINLKDVKSAAVCLDRAMKFDPESLPVRREIAMLESKDAKPTGDVSWADDLGTAIRNLFKR